MDLQPYFDGISELYQLALAVGPAWQMGLWVFILLSVLKSLNVVGKDTQAAFANLAFSYLLSEGDPNQLAGIAAFGAAFYKLWDRWVWPGLKWLYAKVRK